MKLLNLNCWVGRSKNFFPEFINLTREYDPDIITLQEVDESYHNDYTPHPDGNHTHMLSVLMSLYFDTYEFYFSPRQTDWIHDGVSCVYHIGNLVMWKRKKFLLKSSATDFVISLHNTFDNKNLQTMPVNVQSVVLAKEGCASTLLQIMNIHGYYAGLGAGKGDNMMRYLQSENIIKTIRDRFLRNPPIILAGDFNLNPDTQCLKKIEKELSLSNAVIDFKIPCTRTSLYDALKKKQWPHASYILHRNVSVRSCVTHTQSLVSDHAPIIFSFNI